MPLSFQRKGDISEPPHKQKLVHFLREVNGPGHMEGFNLGYNEEKHQALQRQLKTLQTVVAGLTEALVRSQTLAPMTITNLLEDLSREMTQIEIVEGG